MSATYRCIARLPLDIFEDLLTRPENDHITAMDLREAICAKMKKIPRKVKGGATSFECVSTIGGLLTKMSISTLVRILDPILTYEECENLIRRICHLCSPPPRSALSLLQSTDDSPTVATVTGTTIGNLYNPTTINNMRYLPTGLDSLDKCLRGGVRVGTITELVGRAGAGKTQLALQLCVMAAKFGLGCIYVDTERKISLVRLKEISQTRAKNLKQHNANTRYRTPEEVLENVLVHSPRSTQEMLSILSMLEEEILVRNQKALDNSLHSRSLSQTFPIRLVILDSIAAPTRRDFGTDDAPQRAAAIFNCAQMLKKLAHELELAVVVVNQVGLDNLNVKNNSLLDDKVSIKAALGTSWHHCVSTRILLEHDRDPHILDSHEDFCREFQGQAFLEDRTSMLNRRGRVRTATIIKSNVAGLTSTQFKVTSIGLTELSK